MPAGVWYMTGIIGRGGAVMVASVAAGPRCAQDGPVKANYEPAGRPAARRMRTVSRYLAKSLKQQSGYPEGRVRGIERLGGPIARQIPWR